MRCNKGMLQMGRGRGAWGMVVWCGRGVWAGAETGMRTEEAAWMCRMGWAGDYGVGGWCVFGVYGAEAGESVKRHGCGK